MKKLITITVLTLLTLNVHAAIECKKEGRFWYPKNEKAIKIAKRLGVKTCSGKRFKAVVKLMGEKSNVVAGKKSMSIDDVVNSFK